MAELFDVLKNSSQVIVNKETLVKQTKRKPGPGRKSIHEKHTTG